MAVSDAHVFPGFLTPVLTRLSFKSHQLLFSHASAEVRGENTPFQRIENIVGKEENMLVTSIFFFFPKMFSKGFFKMFKLSFKG